MKNLVGIELPEYIEGYGKVEPYSGAFNEKLVKSRREIPSKMVKPEDSKVLASIDEAFEKVGLKDGMTLSFHHHLRNGDYVLNMVLERAAAKGIKNLTIAASSIFPIHAPLVEHIKNGVVTKIIASYISGPVAHAVSKGMLKNPVVMQTHGGRARSIESGEVKIDVAFVAAPTADTYGNINGVQGKSAVVL